MVEKAQLQEAAHASLLGDDLELICALKHETSLFKLYVFLYSTCQSLLALKWSWSAEC